MVYVYEMNWWTLTFIMNRRIYCKCRTRSIWFWQTNRHFTIGKIMDCKDFDDSCSFNFSCLLSIIFFNDTQLDITSIQIVTLPFQMKREMKADSRRVQKGLNIQCIITYFIFWSNDAQIMSRTSCETFINFDRINVELIRKSLLLSPT